MLFLLHGAIRNLKERFDEHMDEQILDVSIEPAVTSHLLKHEHEINIDHISLVRRST